jgi:glutathione S-transferase
VRTSFEPNEQWSLLHAMPGYRPSTGELDAVDPSAEISRTMNAPPASPPQDEDSMKLYGERNPAPNPRRVRIFLAEKSLEIPYENVSIRKRAHKTPEFRAKNSLGQLPVLELDDGTTLCETVSICRYLEELHPTPSLFGETALERAQIDMWIRRIEFVLMQPIAAVWVHAHPLTAGLGTQFKDFGESRRDQAAKAMLWLDRELTGHDYIAGSRFSMADVVTLTTLDFATFIGLELPALCERLRAWHARVSERPSAKA